MPKPNDELMRFADLKAAKIVGNWVTLKRWVEREGFPSGFLMGPATRVWWKSDVHEWLVNRPIERGER
jgi:hypothetical protein